MDAWDFHRWVYSGKLQNLFKVCLWKCKSESKSSLQVTFCIYLLAKWKFEIKTRIVDSCKIIVCKIETRLPLVKAGLVAKYFHHT